MMSLDEAIQYCLKVADQNEILANQYSKKNQNHPVERWDSCERCAEEHRQLAEWLRELKVFKSKKGQWLRMSNLSEQEDDRYRCSRCGNVIHHKNEMDLYTFDSWCGRCGSDNGRH